MDFNTVREFIEANKDNEDVKNYVGGLVTPDRVKGYLDTEEGKKILQPRLDQYFGKGLESWKANNLEKIIDEEVAKKNPAETEEQKRLRKLEKELETEKGARQREALKNRALSFATQKGLPIELVEYLVGHDEDSTLSNLAVLEQVWQTSLQSAVEGKFQEGGRKPVKPQDPQVLDPKKMSTKDINAKWDKMKEKLKDGKFNKT